MDSDLRQAVTKVSSLSVYVQQHQAQEFQLQQTMESSLEDDPTGKAIFTVLMKG
jgi:hypothetical protein